jgi:hypothetical protein
LFRVGEQHVVVVARAVIRSARKRRRVAWPTALHVVATDGDGGADVITTAAIVEGGEAVGVGGGMAGVGYEAYPAPHHAHNNSHAHHAAAQYQYAGAEWGQYHPHPHQVLALQHRLNMKLDLQSLFGLHVT